MDFEILGTGSASCKSTIALIGRMMAHAGGAPSRDKIERRLAA